VWPQVHPAERSDTAAVAITAATAYDDYAINAGEIFAPVTSVDTAGSPLARLTRLKIHTGSSGNEGIAVGDVLLFASQVIGIYVIGWIVIVIGWIVIVIGWIVASVDGVDRIGRCGATCCHGTSIEGGGTRAT
jgi:hypothetical protein